MPSNLVKPGEEAAWERAKNKVESEYPDVAVGSDRYYKLVTTLFESMRGGKSLPSRADMHKAVTLVVRRSAPLDARRRKRCLLYLKKS